MAGERAKTGSRCRWIMSAERKPLTEAELKVIDKINTEALSPPTTGEMFVWLSGLMPVWDSDRRMLTKVNWYARAFSCLPRLLHEVRALRAALRKLRQFHHYSCGLEHSELPMTARDGIVGVIRGPCDCGAAEHNAFIDRALGEGGT